MLVSSEAELEVISTMTDSSTAAIVATIAIPFVLGILLKGVLSKLWSMIGTFQLINALSLIQSTYQFQYMRIYARSCTYEYNLVDQCRLTRYIDYTLSF